MSAFLRRGLLILSFALITVGLITGSAQVLAQEDEEADDVIFIRNVDDLQAIGQNPSASYALLSDIDASVTREWNAGSGFVPIPDFSGVFDGRGYVINSLFIDRSGEENIGLFRRIAGTGTVRGVRLEDVYITGGDRTGALAGVNEGEVRNAHSSGTVIGQGNNYTGGLVGQNIGRVIESSSSAQVSGAVRVGGLAGRNRGSGLVEASYSFGEVTGEESVGGLVGYNDSVVKDSFSTAKVGGDVRVGGLIGRRTNNGQALSSYWDVERSGVTGSQGGTGLTTSEMQEKGLTPDEGGKESEGSDVDVSGHGGRLFFDGLFAGAENLALPLIDKELVVEWSLERLVSGKGEPEKYEWVTPENGGSISVEKHTKRLADDAYEIVITYSNHGDERFLLRSAALVTIPFADFRWWNGYLNELHPRHDPYDIPLLSWFPANAALGPNTAIALGVNPRYVYSRVESGLIEDNDQNSLRLGLPFVLDPGEQFELSYVIAAYPSRYGHRDVVQAYYRLFPEAYRPAEGIHPSVISTQTTYLYWNPNQYRSGRFLDDLFRRFTGGRGGWEWAYAPMIRGGDWAITYEWSEGFRGHTRASIDRHREQLRTRLANAAFHNVSPMYYVNFLWAEKTLILNHFPEAIGEYTENRSWGQDTVLGVYPGPNRYGQLFAESIRRIAEDFPESRGIGWDSTFGHQVVPEDVAGVLETPRRSHHNGEIFALQGVAYADLLDLNHTLFSDGYRRANAVNLKLPSPYFIGARTDTALYEGAPMAEPERFMRHEAMRARLGTQKVLTWHKHLTPEQISWVDWDALSGDEVREAFRQIHQDNLLLSYYWGGIPIPRTPALGIERTMRAIPELIDLARQGWQPSPAVDSPSDILIARFGEGLGARVAVINPTYEDRSVPLYFPASYWNGAKLLLAAEDGQSLSFQWTGQGTSVEVMVPAREVTIVRVVGVVGEGASGGDASVHVTSTYEARSDRSEAWSFQFNALSHVRLRALLAWNGKSERAVVSTGDAEAVHRGGEPIALVICSSDCGEEGSEPHFDPTRQLTLIQQPKFRVDIDASVLRQLQVVPESGSGGLTIQVSDDAAASIQDAVRRITNWYLYYTNHVMRRWYVPDVVSDDVADISGPVLTFHIGEGAELHDGEEAAIRLVDGRVIEIRARSDELLADAVLAFLSVMDEAYPYYGILDPVMVGTKYLSSAGLLYSGLPHEPQAEPVVQPTLVDWLRRARLIND